jgi:2',3'-cyclic-nucleotide 2'-phosphodiesterase (5'-nucleotidase family)
VTRTAVGRTLLDPIRELAQDFHELHRGVRSRLETRDLALINASGVIAGVDKGSLAYSDWYAVMPFADTLQVGEMTGAQIRDMVVNNAKRIIRPDEAAGMDLKNTYVGRGFLHFSGALRYTIRLGRDAGETVAENITLHGKPIEEQLDRVFTVVFNSYIGNGGGDSCWNGKKIRHRRRGDGFDIGSCPRETRD